MTGTLLLGSYSERRRSVRDVIAKVVIITSEPTAEME